MPAKKKAAFQDVPPPATPPDELGTMLGILDYLRERVLAKIGGVPEPEIRTAGVESGTNLLGMVKHLAWAERNQFLGEKPTSWPKTFRANDEETVEEIVADYRDVVRRANEAIRACDDLSDPVGGTRGRPVRWRLAHMIEETGRHAGQMDILRENIDGATGR